MSWWRNLIQGKELYKAVSLAKVDPLRKDITDSLTRALDLIKFRVIPPISSVVIKPNLCYYWHASTGYTTDPRVVASLIDHLREKLGDVPIKIAEADATAMKTRHSFEMLGYTKLAKEKGVELFNLSKDRVIERKIAVNNKRIVFKVPSTLLDADLFINVPKLKTMKATKISCALKNVFGCIASTRKVVYHPILDETIVGINKILHPHLNIVDGIVGLGSVPAKLNLLIASTDPFSTDWIAAKIMGYNPARVRFLKIARHEKLVHPNNIVVVGEKLEGFRQLFPHHSFIVTTKENIQIKLLRAYCKITGDVLPPIMET